MSYLGKVVYLTEAQLQTLLTNGSITVDGTTVTYSADDLYVTPQGADPITDVKINNVSIASNGIATIPIADGSNLGVVKKSGTGYSIEINANGEISVVGADSAGIKSPNSNSKRPVVPARQHEAVFYGLSKVAGVDLASETVTVGTYPDESKQAIQTMLGTNAMIAPVEDDITSDNPYAIGELFCYNGKLYQATAAIAVNDYFTPGTNCAVVDVAGAFPHDVQVNGTSVVTNGVANIPIAGDSGLGVVKTNSTNYGVIVSSSGNLSIAAAGSTLIQEGTNQYRPLVPYYQDKSVFYGLAKAAGADESSSSLPVGTYRTSAASAIHTMLNGTVTMSGSTPSIIALDGIRYICGECTSLSITVPSSGTIDVRFTSGTTPTVLTVTPPTGVTIKWPAWFDPTSLSASTTYEINIEDGEFAVVMAWA